MIAVIAMLGREWGSLVYDRAIDPRWVPVDWWEDRDDWWEDRDDWWEDWSVNRVWWEGSPVGWTIRIVSAQVLIVLLEYLRCWCERLLRGRYFSKNCRCGEHGE